MRWSPSAIPSKIEWTDKATTNIYDVIEWWSIVSLFMDDIGWLSKGWSSKVSSLLFPELFPTNLVIFPFLENKF